MAFQRGSVKLEGKAGDLSFYKVDDNYLVKQQGGHSKERITNDPSFERTRENAREFGNASSFAKQMKLSLKQTLQPTFELFHDPSLTNRLNKRMSSILKADSVNSRGNREVFVENLALFTGFSINSAAALKDTFFIPIEPTWLKEEQVIRLQLPAFRPASVMDIPEKASQFQFHLCATIMRQGVLSSSSSSMQSQLFFVDTLQKPQTLDLILNDAEVDAVLVFFGISFFNAVAGYAVPLIDPCKNALDVIKVLLKSE